MKNKTKIVPIYVANDGAEFDTKKECKQHELFLKLNKLHKILIQLGFYKRFKIVPYFHNVDITNIEPREFGQPLHNGKYIFYTLMYGRMGNGDCRVRLKGRKNHIILLKYNTDHSELEPMKYLGKIPISWLDKEAEEIASEVEKYISERKVFVKVVNTTSTVTYKEV